MRGQTRFRDFDRGLFLAPILICLIGALSVYSAGQTLVNKQLLWMGVGILLMLLFLRTSYFKLQDFAWPFYIGSLILLAAVFFTPARFGARRWIDLGGFSLQPSELAKLAVILILARFFSDHRREYVSKRGLWRPILYAAAPFFLILKEPDLGTALILVPVFFAMLYVWGVRAKTLLGQIALGLLLSPLFVLFLKEYQRTRLLVFLNPNLDPLGAGYTIIQSKIAIGSGGLIGKGFLGGTQTHLQFLPEKHTDFIFGVLAEEGGLAASLCLLILFAYVIKKGFDIAAQTPDRFGSQLACGISTLLAVQVFINMGMTMGLLPVVGVPLPLVSYGGSSVVMTMVSLGLLLNIKLHKPLF
ncbi:MAG: rod shape-determining protein RodA [Candidatus Omnitrophica bacterium]|nr:rod shape-determining protein RodA [Candidatus Omnitrophota bacterium]